MPTPNSLLTWMKQLIKVRRQCSELGEGPVQVIPVNKPNVLAHCYQAEQWQTVVLHNLAGQKSAVQVSLSQGSETEPVPLLGNGRLERQGDGQHRITLPGYGFQWYRIQYTQQ